MLLSAFGVDQPDLLSADTCLVGRCEKNDVSDDSVDERYVIVTVRGQQPFCKQQDSVLCLRQRFDKSVRNCDIVFPNWVLDYFGISNGSHITAVPAAMNFVDPALIRCIKLTYKGWKCYRHWDEVATVSKLCIPGTWSAGWPSGISVRMLIKFLPILLDKKILIENSYLVVDILDLTMVRT